jgi:hypothetical protein
VARPSLTDSLVKEPAWTAREPPTASLIAAGSRTLKEGRPQAQTTSGPSRSRGALVP